MSAARKDDQSGLRQLALSEVCEVRAGFGFPKRHQGMTEGDLPFAKVSDISAVWHSGERYLRGAANYVSFEVADELRARSMPAGTTVMAKIGEAVKLNRRVILGQPTIVDNNVMGWVPDESLIRPEYLFFISQTLPLGELTRATTVPALRKTDIDKIPIMVPPLDEQDQVVDTVERHLARVSEGRSQLVSAQKALDPYRVSTLRSVLGGELRSMPLDVQEALRIAPRSPLREHASIQYGWTAKASDQSVGPRMLRITDIQDGRVDWDGVPYCEMPDDKLDTYLLHAGDIVFARIGATTGKSYLVGPDVPTAVFASYLIRVRPQPLLRSDFLALFFQGADYWAHIHSASRGIGRPAVNGRLLGTLDVPLPPLDVQEAAVSYANRHLDMVRAYASTLDRNIQDAERLQAAILVHGMRGSLHLAQRDNPHAVRSGV